MSRAPSGDLLTSHQGSLCSIIRFRDSFDRGQEFLPRLDCLKLSSFISLLETDMFVTACPSVLRPRQDEDEEAAVRVFCKRTDDLPSSIH